MSKITYQSRSALLTKLAIGTALILLLDLSMTLLFAGDSPLVTADDPPAKALKYVENCSKATDAKPGSKCGTSSLYQGASGAAQWPCAISPGKQAKATGRCASWLPEKSLNQ